MIEIDLKNFAIFLSYVYRKTMTGSILENLKSNVPTYKKE